MAEEISIEARLETTFTDENASNPKTFRVSDSRAAEDPHHRDSLDTRRVANVATRGR